MDRKYKAPDNVRVYLGERSGKPIAIHRAKPHSIYGYDSYRYKGTLYPGFQDRATGEVYIIVDAADGA